MRKTAILSALLLLLGLAAPATAGQEALVSAAAGGIYPPGATFGGIPINGLHLTFALELEDGVGLGEFFVTLLGVSVGGLEREIVVQGKVTAGSRSAANAATFSGTCTVDMGDGTLPAPGVPFTASVTVDANDQGVLGLVIGATTLPNATVDTGSMTISVPPTPTPLIP